MVERDLNSIITYSFKGQHPEEVSGQKVPDPMHGTGRQNIFDSFYITPWNLTYYIEAKLIKSDLGSLNFNKIEDHQYRELRIIRNNTEHIQEYIKPVIAAGWYVPRKIFEVLFIHINLIEHLKTKLNKNSIVKKELKQIYEYGLFTKILSKKIEGKKGYKKYFDPKMIKIMTTSDWEKIFNDKT